MIYKNLNKCVRCGGPIFEGQGYCIGCSQEVAQEKKEVGQIELSKYYN